MIEIAYTGFMEIIVNQILIMAILIVVGYGLCKSHFIDDQVTKGISNILLRFVIPVTIMESFNQAFSVEKLKQILFVSFLSVVFTLLTIMIAKMFFKDDERIEQYAVIFTNKGFVGIPIIAAVFGSEAITIVTPIIVVTNIFAWTYGMALLYNEKLNFDLRKLITNPSIVGLLCGLVLFFLPFELPYVFSKSMNYLTSMNTPLAMMIIGAYLADESMQAIFMNKAAYKVSFFRLIVTPLVVLFLIQWLPLDLVTKGVMVVSFGVPSAANTAMFAQLAGEDYSFGAQIVCLTTMLSGLSLPLLLYVMEMLL